MNLAYRMRPQTLDEYVGQEQLVGEGKLLRNMITSGNLTSMIFWGPPGSGKTTLAHLIAKSTEARFFQLSGVTSGKAELLKIVDEAKKSLATLEHKKSILFIDEIHRWNKAQQDALLPYVESGLITLIGATTENPSFEVISALLSRSRIFTLEGLSEDHLSKLIDRALKDKKRGVGEYKKTITPKAKKLLIQLSGGDARVMLNAIEIAVTTTTPESGDTNASLHHPHKTTNKKDSISPELIQEIFQSKSAGLYDKKADEHYNTISAYIKSMRASQVDAALYYLAKMVEGGEDPKFIARRMVIFASEDIGMAQPTALVVANEVFKTCETIGYPECAINLAHGTVYMSKARKDRSAYDGFARAREDAINYPNEPIPLHLRNAPTKLMKDIGYAKGYSWEEGNVGANKELSYLPEKLKNKKYYKEK